MNLWKPRLGAALASALFLGACATGQSVSDTPRSQIALAPGKARIAVYRVEVMGFGIQPTVNVDGRATGTCTPNAIFYVDVPPGKHEITARTEVTATETVTLSAGQTVYVECSIGLGVLLGRPKLVALSPATARKRTEGLAFKGKF